MTEPARIVPAATIMMVRDADAFEVLMVKRHHQIEFAGGALVFPGGKVAKEDHDPSWADLVDGAEDDSTANALRIAAIREAFEESGLLLARPSSRRGIGNPLVHPQEAPGLFDATSGELEPGAFQVMMRAAGLVLALDALAPFANWLTPDRPDLMPRRFDTHFFVAIAPPEQIAACDGHEAVDACWIAPKEALADAAANRRVIVFPTRMNLEMLSRSADAGAAIADARARPRIKVTPVTEMHDGREMLRIPEEAGYAVTMEPFDIPIGVTMPKPAGTR